MDTSKLSTNKEDAAAKQEAKKKEESERSILREQRRTKDRINAKEDLMDEIKNGRLTREEDEHLKNDPALTTYLSAQGRHMKKNRSFGKFALYAEKTPIQATLERSRYEKTQDPELEGKLNDFFAVTSGKHAPVIKRKFPTERTPGSPETV